MYTNPFLLTDAVGNNVFSYEIRSDKKLFVPSVIDGDFFDTRIGQKVAFEDVDKKGILHSCYGLEYFIRTTFVSPWKEESGIPVIIVDNHNHVLYFWYEALKKGVISQGSTLVHIDEHSDLWENENDLPKLPPNPPHWGGKSEEWTRGELTQDIHLEKVFHFTNYQCNVGNYIQPALREGIIDKMLRIEWSGDMDTYTSYEPEHDESIILNLDLDFFAPELDYIPFDQKKECILRFARYAKLITIATSPFFIDQERAIQCMKEVFEK